MEHDLVCKMHESHVITKSFFLIVDKTNIIPAEKFQVNIFIFDKVINSLVISRACLFRSVKYFAQLSKFDPVDFLNPEKISFPTI